MEDTCRRTGEWVWKSRDSANQEAACNNQNDQQPILGANLRYWIFQIIFIQIQMFKVLTFAAMMAAGLGLRVNYNHQQQWADASNLTDKQKEWDDFFRKQIKALGDSVTEKVSGDKNFKYLDTTNDNDEVVAWEVDGGVKGEDWIVNKVVQVKTYPDKDDKNIKYVTKTVYERGNLPAVTKREFA